MDTDKLIKKKLDELKERFYIELSNNHLYLAEDASAKALTIFFKSSLKEALQARDKWWKTKLKALLKGCEEQNGLPFCKNCGLSEDFINDDYDVWLKKEQKENRIIEKNL